MEFLWKHFNTNLVDAPTTVKLMASAAHQHDKLVNGPLRGLPRWQTVMKLAAGPAIALAIGMPMWNYLTNNNEFLTWMLDIGRAALGAPLPPDAIRQTFNDTPIVIPEPVKHHTHADAAANRSCASLFAQTMSASMAMKPFFFQMAAADQRKGYDGSRTWYWAKDVTIEPRYVIPVEHNLIVMVDVDYYVDMPAFLAEHSSPVLLYTTTPTDVAESGDHGIAFTFTEDNKIHMKVSGGAEYEHEIWNYGVDNLMAVSYSYGMPSRVATYLIDRRRVDKHRSLVLLTPTGLWTGFYAWFASLLYGNALRRLKLVTDINGTKFTRLYIMNAETGLSVATGKPGSYASITVPASVDDVLKTVATNSKVTISAPTVESYLPEGNRNGAAILTEYLRAGTGDRPPTVYPVSMGVRRYQFAPGNYDPEAKPSLVAFMSPLVAECFAPDQCFANDERCVTARITNLANDVEPTPQLMTIIHEFVELLIPDSVAHTLVPVDIEAVLAAQARPSQRVIIEQAAVEGERANELIKMFVKKEAYTKPNDPRPISTLPPGLKIEYAKYVMAITAYIKQMPWYAFGRTPREIATAIANLAVNAEWLVKTDFERFDGRVAVILRVVERLLMTRAFRREYVEKVAQLHRQQISARAVTTHGVKYTVGTARLSGSPETAVFNGVDNAFINFLAKRITRVGNTYPTAAEAWAALGLYGGDDGLTPNINTESLERAAAMCGQKIKAEKVLRGQLGVQFLARNYGPNVWFGDPNSCCDLPRQLSKLHATVFLPPSVTAEQKLLEKCRGYYCSDRNTPIIGPLVRRALILADEATVDPLDDPLGLRSWSARVPMDEQYPNLPDAWMDEYRNRALPDFDMQKFYVWIMKARTVADLLSPPLCCEPKPPAPTAPVVVDDAVAQPKAGTKEPAKTRRRKRASDGKPEKKDPRAAVDKWADLGQRRGGAHKRK